MKLGTIVFAVSVVKLLLDEINEDPTTIRESCRSGGSSSLTDNGIPLLSGLRSVSTTTTYEFTNTKKNIRMLTSLSTIEV